MPIMEKETIPASRADISVEIEKLRLANKELEEIRERVEKEKAELVTELETSRSTTVNKSHSRKRDLGLQSLIKNFSGDDNGQTVKEFIRNIKLVAETGNWDENDKKFICRLKATGAAGGCLEAHPELLSSQATFNDYEKVLTQRFEKTLDPERWLLTLSTIKQANGEGARAFADRCRQIGLKATPTPSDPREAEWSRAQLDRTLLAAFVRGLKGAAAVTLQIHPPKSLEDAIEAAERVESVQANAKEYDHVFPVAFGDNRKEDTQEEINAIRESPINNSPPDWKGACFECGGRGHFARECANRRNKSEIKQRVGPDNGAEGGKPRDRVVRPKFCFVCGDPDHMSFSCTQRAQKPNVSRRVDNSRRGNVISHPREGQNSPNAFGPMSAPSSSPQ
jgi:hypothetical protein